MNILVLFLKKEALSFKFDPMFIESSFPKPQSITMCPKIDCVTTLQKDFSVLGDHLACPSKEFASKIDGTSANEKEK